jgi:filamentous hemagglutinin family protein
MRAWHRHIVFRQMAAALLLCGIVDVSANPTGMTVQSGSASPPAFNGSTLTVTTSQSAILNWKTFNIAAGETTLFNQPSAYSVVVNNIHDANASQIYGSLQANGMVVLLNSSGFYFGPDAFIKTGGLIVSTAHCIPPQNTGGAWQFNGPPPLKSIVNYGQIQIGNGGSAFLIADDVENHGDIEAPGGTVGLASGQTVLLSERPDGRGMSMEVTMPRRSVNNYGTIVADGGTIAMNAKVVNQNGFLQANSVRNVGGVIELVASDQLNLGANSQILAKGGDSAGGSAGGSVTLRSGNDFSDDVGSRIDVSGGSQGGNGGNVEISAPNILSLNSSVNAGAQPGWSSGVFALDPENIVLGYSGATGPDGSGTINGTGTSGTLNVNVNSAFQNINVGQILLEASGSITLSTGTIWDLSGSTGRNSGLLTLEAGGNITLNSNSSITDGNDWSVNLLAGVSFPSGTVQYGVGNISLNGGGTILTSQGSINLEAGNGITVGTGRVCTGNGGSITATALAGSVNTGTDAYGYDFYPAGAYPTYYVVDSGLGGISTANGGNVTINAGLDVVSYLPKNSAAGDAGTGAFGSAPGNVTINAGRNVTGHYVVANGTGTITAGNNAGTSSAQLALSLISGGWNVNARQNITLQEVRNPNGTLNYFAGAVLPSNNYFDYAPDNYVNLTAGNSVQLTGSGVPRKSGPFESALPEIYPGILNIVAGAGGVTLDNEVILFPSPQGSLSITTTGGGALVGNSQSSLVNLVMSDSSSAQYLSSSTFGSGDHASVPVHLGSPTPIALNISGDMDNILLDMPEAAQINVVGNMNNSRFIGQNLNAGDVTSITVGKAAKENMENSGLLNPATDSSLIVGGDILNRSDFTSVTVSTAPDLGLLAQDYSDPSFGSSLLSLLHYDPATQLLTFQGPMTTAQLAALTSLTIQVLDAYGNPEVDSSGNPVTTTVSILAPATANALFQASQNIPQTTSTGYLIGGGGTFNVNARNLDLGTTLGIQSVGPLNNPALANYFLNGAEINVDLTGNLDMFSTTICSLNGGDVNVNAGGYVNVGSTTFAGNNKNTRGIFTVAKSDVTVVAGGDIDLNGSRIAAYDGGNVTVESLHGNVNAGNGANGYVNVEDVYVDPVTRQIFTANRAIPGSGIIATTFPLVPGSAFPALGNIVGNILVETPEGDIVAGLSGITQVPQNGTDNPKAVAELLAGYELRDANGNRVLAGDLNNGTPVVVLNDQNIVTPGPTIQVLPTGSSLPVSLTQVMDAQGQPLLDAAGNPLYVETLDTKKRQVVEFVNGSIQPYVNADGEPVKITAEPQDIPSIPFDKSQGSPVFVLGRDIDTGGSGIIGQNIVEKATGFVQGVIVGAYSVDVTASYIQKDLWIGPLITATGPIDTGTSKLIGPEVNADADPTDIISANANGKSTLGQGTTANATAQAASNNNASQTAASTDQGDDDDKKQKEKEVALVQKVSRVTVILPAMSPPPSSSQKQTSTQPL